ncbi:MAG: hypothetical protein IKC87_04565 [Clostridia bacterium]|nr:hypothetical protein [Clostridia bacterium]
MKKGRLLLLLIVALILSLCLSACSVEDEGDKYIKWELSEDMKTLTDGTDTYTRVKIPAGYSLENKFYYYYNGIYHNESYYQVESAELGSNIIYLDGARGTIAYCKGDGEEKLRKFLDGEYTSAKLYSMVDYTITDIDNSLVQSLEALTDGGTTHDVTKLEDLDYYNVWIFGHEENLMTVTGTVFDVDGVLHYMKYSDLDNSNFDSYGDFSFRSGSVTLYPLTDDLSTSVSATFESLEDYRIISDSEYVYSDSELPSIELDESSAFVVLIVLAVVFGIILPAVPLAFALYFLYKKRVAYPLPSYVTLVASSVWLGLGIAVLILVLV